MAVNQYYPFATSGGAGVLTPASYSALAARLTGFVNGVADPSQCNTVWRQSSVVAATFGQFIVDYSGGDSANDDGNVATLEASFVKALKAVANINPTGSTQKAPKLASVTVTSPAVNIATSTNTLLSMTVSQNNLGTGTYASGVYTCGTGEAGLYLVSAYIWFPAPVGGFNTSVSVRKNGSQWQANGQMSAGNTGDAQVANLFYLIPLAVGDTLSFYGYQQSGSTYNTNGCGASITLISAY